MSLRSVAARTDEIEAMFLLHYEDNKKLNAVQPHMPTKRITPSETHSVDHPHCTMLHIQSQRFFAASAPFHRHLPSLSTPMIAEVGQLPLALRHT